MTSELQQLQNSNEELQSQLAKMRERNAELEAAVKSSLELLAENIREADLLRQFDHEMARSEQLDYILDYALNWIIEHSDAEHALIAQWHSDRSMFEVMISHGRPFGQDFKPRTPLELPSALIPAPDRQESGTDALFTEDGRSVVVDLRRTDGTLLALLHLQRADDAEIFSPYEQLFLRHFGDRLAISMHHAILFDQVEKLNKYRSQLFWLLSHDLRQPLTIMKGYLELLQMALRSKNMDVMEDYTSTIVRSTNDLQNLLEEVLLKEQVDNPSRDDWKIMDLKDVYQQALEKHAPLASLKSQELVEDITEEETPALGMTLQLKEAAANLISNAIKYTPDNGHVETSLWVENDRIYFQVKDDGYGISEDRQERLWQAFFRAKEPGTEKIKGTGLGLSLVKGIVENHDGEVFFTSEGGKGSTFGFWLPRAKSDEHDKAVQDAE